MVGPGGAHAAGGGEVGRLCSRANLQVQKIVTVTSNARPGIVYELGAILESDGDISGLLYSGSYLGDRCFTLKDIQKQAVLVNVDGRDIVKLHALSDFDGFRGGTLELNYLYNGISKTYLSYTMTLERAGVWRLQKQNVPFNFIRFQKRTSLGITIGVNGPETSWR
jgi:hypothetical protein